MTNTLDCLSNSLKQNEFRLMSWESTQLLAYFFIVFFKVQLVEWSSKILTCFALHKIVSFTEIKKIPIIILQDVHERTVS